MLKVNISHRESEREYQIGSGMELPEVQKQSYVR